MCVVFDYLLYFILYRRTREPWPVEMMVVTEVVGGLPMPYPSSIDVQGQTSVATEQEMGMVHGELPFYHPSSAAVSSTSMATSSGSRFEPIGAEEL